MNDQGLCCLVDPSALDPEVRTLGEHLAVSRDLLTALTDPMRQDLVQLLARAELNVGEIAARVTLSRPTVSHHLSAVEQATCCEPSAKAACCGTPAALAGHSRHYGALGRERPRL